MTRLASVSGVRHRFALCASLACASCHGKSAPLPAASALAVGSSSAKPVDRLAPDELAASSSEVWGFAVPRDMKIEYRYADATYLVGPVKPDALANYVRDRVQVVNVEIGAGRTIFPNARITGGASDRLYELDVIPEPGRCELLIRDLTPPQVQPGLSDAERWKQAGMTPDGRPIDMKKFE